jgi:hypothetical protein
MSDTPFAEPQTGKRKSPAQLQRLASLLAQDVPVCDALRQSGWSNTQSVKGWDAVPDRVMAMLPKRAKKLATLGKTIDKETRKHLIRGRLIDNLVKGKDGGAMSAKILGSDSELNLWVSDYQAGLIILNVPQSIAQLTREERERMAKPVAPLPLDDSDLNEGS